MQVGDRITVVPETITKDDDRSRADRRPISGTICYIHPEGRYYTV